MVLLDSEGTDAVRGEGSDDHCIFILTILLASVLVFNSVGVPSRNDFDELAYPFGRFFNFIHGIFIYYTFFITFILVKMQLGHHREDLSI